MGRLLLHAPNVHVGGGFVLLKDILSVPYSGQLWANLDMRASTLLELPAGAEYYFVRPSLVDRVKAEFRLYRTANSDDIVFCFHGMPPLLPARGRVIVFQQNRLYLGLDSLSNFSTRTRIRLACERFVCRLFKKRAAEYIVQTPSMQSEVIAWHGGNPVVRVIPFMKPASVKSAASTAEDPVDFVYVADGEAHKNHRALISAWILLAQEGIYPSLGLTLPDRSMSLWQEFEPKIAMHRLRIVNFGAMSHEAILALYCSAQALVFPSITESFGLPLLEAAQAGLPIIASELDYVRDVCEPCETFNPHSSRSIARAIKRFLNMPGDRLRIRTAAEFLDEIAS